MRIKPAKRVIGDQGRLQHRLFVIGTYQKKKRREEKQERQRRRGEKRERSVSRIASTTAVTLDSK